MAYVAPRVSALLSLGFLWGPAYAQGTEPVEADPPGRAARLSHIEGDVSLQPVGEADWAPAFINRPLTTGDKVWTEPGARAEIHVGPAAVRLDGNTGFSFLNVDDDTIQMRLTAGVMHVSVPRLEGSEQIEIDTPNVALWLLRTGTYRIEVNDAGDSTVVKVREGAVDARSPSQDLVVHAGQAVTFAGTDDIVAQINTLGAPDDFDSWSEERARRELSAAASRTAEYVSPDVTGYEDLEDHGSWSSEPDYGYVWTPRNVAVDWAPYRYGRWVWVTPWGWTWVDDARWGYAPFHYGRWVHVRHRWCWVPGPRHHRAVYAPALVGWVGSPGLHVTWYPLGPRDVYVPWRRHSWRYVERVNVSNASRVIRSHIQDAYERRAPRHRGRLPRGVTSASNEAFTRARPVRDHRVQVDERSLSGAITRAAAPRIDPRRESRLGGSPVSARVPPRRIADRQVIVRRAPPPVAATLVRDAVRNRDDLGVPRASIQPRPERHGRAAFVRDRQDRNDRPPRDLQGNRQWQTQSSDRAPRAAVHGDQPSQGQRLQQARERQMREHRPQDDSWRRSRSAENRRSEPVVQQRWRTQADEVRQPPRAQQPRAQERQQLIRERLQQRQVERRPVEQRPVQRPDVQRPSVQRPDVQRSAPSAPRPQVQRPARSEAPRAPRQSPPRRDDNYSRTRRQ